MKNIIIKEASNEANGLKAFQDKHSENMYNVTKFSISGRSNGIVCRYNEDTGCIIYDGSTWRSYKPYKWMSITDIKKFLDKNI